jgi:hypothetical protein
LIVFISAGCPTISFNSDTILSTPNPGSNYGVMFNVSCRAGFVFDALEFYTQQPDGSMVSKSSVRMECLTGGVWNVQRYPQCVRKWHLTQL